MKKLFSLIAIFFLIGLTAFGQTRKPVFIVPDSTTAFGVQMPSGVLIFDTGSKRIWALTAKVSSGDDLSTSTKDFVASGDPADGSSFYTADGTISSDRIVAGNSKNLTINSLNSLTMSTFGATGLFSIGALGNWLLSGTDDGFIQASDEITINSISDNLLLQQNTNLIGIGGVPLSTTKLDIQFPEGSLSPLSFYEDRIGGASTGDSYQLGFYFNDDLGARTLGSSIIARVSVAPTTGDVKTDLTIGNDFKIHEDGRVLITPNALTAGANAQMEIRGIVGVTGNTTLYLKANGTGASNLGINIVNSSTQQLFRVSGAGHAIFNNSALVTGDVQIKSLNNANLFFSNGGTDNIGIGTNVPNASSLIEMSSTTKGFLPPRMTTGQRNSIASPSDGLMIFNLTTGRMQHYDAFALSWINM